MSTIKAWVTKYALTEGIELVDANECGGGMIVYGDVGYGGCYAHGEGRHWHRTPESALKRAEEMRKAKIVSVKKQLRRLEDMAFFVPAESTVNGEAP